MMTLDVHRLVVDLTPSMGSPPIELVLKILGIRVPSETAREIVERLALLWRIQREARETQEARLSTQNGHERS